MIDWVETKKQFGRSDLTGRRPKVSVRCDQCNRLGSKIINNKSVVNGSIYEWVCKSCSLKRQWEDGCFANHSNNMKNRWKDKNYREIFQSEEFKTKKKRQSNKIWSDPHKKQEASDRSKNLWSDAEFRNKCINSIDLNERSKKAKKLWESSQYRNKIVKASREYFRSEEYKKKSMLTREEVISRSKELHGDKYDYSLVVYNGYSEKIDILCKTHGVFSQRVINHLQGCGCPKCPKHTSLQQKDLIKFLSSMVNNIEENDRELISPYEIDVVLPDFNIAIEYNGIYWHSYNKKESQFDMIKHSYKHDECLNKGYKLIQINENEWKNKRHIIESKLMNEVGLAQKIYARKCQIVNLSSQDHNDFMDMNHLQGGKNASVRYGLKFNDDIICVMSFSKHQKHQWEIVRFANITGVTVVGGASKLFKHFVKNHNPNQIMTYADRRYSTGNLYKKLGFELISITKPNYCYVKGNGVFSRQQFQKHKLKDRLDLFDSDLTEAENMFNNGYRRMWDAGHYKFLKVFKKVGD